MSKIFIWLLFIFLLAGPSALHAEESREYQLKAGFLVNFARFITWPAESFPPEHEEFTFCIAGSNPFGDALEPVRSKKIQGRPVTIIYVASLKDVPPCQLLYVSKSEKNNLDHLADLTAKHPIVAVSDIQGFAASGGTIEFVMLGTKLTFIVNNTSLHQRGILASASMLGLAADVF